MQNPVTDESLAADRDNDTPTHLEAETQYAIQTAVNDTENERMFPSPSIINSLEDDRMENVKTTF